MGGIAGTGTINTIPKFTTTSGIGDSIATEVGGTKIDIAGGLGVSGSTTIDLLSTENIVVDGATDPRAITLGVMRFLHTPSIPNTRTINFVTDANGMQGTKAINVEYAANGLVTGDTGTTLEIIVDAGTSTGGHVHGMHVSQIGDTGLSSCAIFTNPLVDVLHQQAGVFASAETAFLYDDSLTTFTDVTTEFGSDASDTQMFDEVDDFVYIGHSSKFSQIAFTLDTPASGSGIKSAFEYSDGVGGWTAFGATDGTNGMRVNGIVSFLLSSIPAWAADTVNGVAGKFWIRIQRTQASLTTPPIEDLVQIVASTLYEWDKNGDVTMHGLTVDGTVVDAVALAAHLVDTANPHTTTVENLDNTTITAPALDDVLTWNGSIWINQSLAASLDKFVGITAADTTPGYLNDKLVAGTDITLTVNNPGANETITIDAVTGETNTASNQGAGGVGLYKTKTGVDLEFKNINAGSSKVTVTDDVANDEVDVDIVEGNIVHQNLSGAGTNTHAQIDTHITNTSGIFYSGGEVYMTDDTRADKKLSVSLIQQTFGRNNANATNQYMRTVDGVPSNLSSFVLPYDATLVGIGMSGSDPTDTWTAEVRRNGSATILDSLQIVTATTNTDMTKNTDLVAGDVVQLYMTGTGVAYPHVTLYFRRRTV